MTRKEVIQLESEKQSDVETFRVFFRKGAEWADKTMIEKACKWLQNLVYDSYIEMDEDDIEDFRAAMEE